MTSALPLYRRFALLASALLVVAVGLGHAVQDSRASPDRPAHAGALRPLALLGR